MLLLNAWSMFSWFAPCMRHSCFIVAPHTVHVSTWAHHIFTSRSSFRISATNHNAGLSELNCRRLVPGLTNAAHFAKIHRIRPGRIQNVPKLLCIIQKISKNKKVRKICKKTRWNSKINGRDFFVKSTSFGWLKFKFRQISESGPTWPMTLRPDILCVSFDGLVHPWPSFEPLLMSRGQRGRPMVKVAKIRPHRVIYRPNMVKIQSLTTSASDDPW
jgi:hypothetical protein